MKWDALTSQAKREAIARYDADNTKQITLKLNLRTDSDILAYLEQVKQQSGGMQGLIKRLLREEIARKK